MIQHGFFDRILHRFALDNRALGKLWFRRECERNGCAFDPQRENVFIAGLARAGSTALLNELYNSGGFGATTYAMMPLVLAPSMARLLARLPRTAAAPAERAHGDGIEVGLDSPEALDGIFWTAFLPARGDRIEAREVPAATLREYAMFIDNLLLDAQAGRYLSKMNQGIDKIAALAAYFERSVFLVPFRDPLQQAASLQRQHRRFAHLSAYEKKYFAWLGHHEFGALHRRFCPDPAAPDEDRAADDINYWLRQWRDTYAYLSQLADLYPNLLPVCYEQMTQSVSLWENLSRRLHADISGAGLVDRNRGGPAPGADIDRVLLEDCRLLYAGMKQQGPGGADS